MVRAKDSFFGVLSPVCLLPPFSASSLDGSLCDCLFDGQVQDSAVPGCLTLNFPVLVVKI